MYHYSANPIYNTFGCQDFTPPPLKRIRRAHARYNTYVFGIFSRSHIRPSFQPVLQKSRLSRESRENMAEPVAYRKTKVEKKNNPKKKMHKICKTANKLRHTRNLHITYPVLLRIHVHVATSHLRFETSFQRSLPAIDIIPAFQENWLHVVHINTTRGFVLAAYTYICAV